eukprot:scaffold5674_cov142-Skeletonema_menzelii.AAC.5
MESLRKDILESIKGGGGALVGTEQQHHTIKSKTGPCLILAPHRLSLERAEPSMMRSSEYSGEKDTVPKRVYTEKMHADGNSPRARGTYFWRERREGAEQSQSTILIKNNEVLPRPYGYELYSYNMSLSYPDCAMNKQSFVALGRPDDLEEDGGY